MNCHLSCTFVIKGIEDLHFSLSKQSFQIFIPTHIISTLCLFFLLFYNSVARDKFDYSFSFVCFSWLAFKTSPFRSLNSVFIETTAFFHFHFFIDMLTIALDYLIIIASGLKGDATGVWQANHSNGESRSQWAHRTASPLAADIPWHMERLKKISHFNVRGVKMLWVHLTNLIKLSRGWKSKLMLKACPMAYAR